MKIKLLIITLALAGSANAQLPSYLWAKGAGGNSMDNGMSVATDASGNSIVTGYFISPAITFGTTVLTNADSLGNAADVFIVKYNAGGTVLWAKSAGGIANDYGNCVATDASGNIFVTGSFSSPTITFGTTVLTNVAPTFTDIFIVKYDPNGNVLWAKSAGGTNWDTGTGVTTDTSGNAIITGYFASSSMTFGTTTLSTTSPITNDIYLVKYDAGGNVLWARSDGGSSNDNVFSVSADASGNIFVTGYFISPSITFGTTILTQSGPADYFLVKYDTGGNVLWAKDAGGSDFEAGYSVCTDTGGNILVTGSFLSSSVTFGTTTLTNTGTSTIFLVKYDQGGNVLWAKSEGGSTSDVAYGVYADASGDILLAGALKSPTITFGTTTLTNVGISDVFIVKYTSAGNVIWAKSAGGTLDDECNSVAADASGNIFITGFFRDPSIAFGTTTLTCAGGLDFFLAKLADTATTAIAEVDFTDAMTVFPNPFSAQVTLLTTISLNNATLRIDDCMSQTVAQIENINGQTITLNRGNLPAGIYFVHLSQDNKLLATRKIIITN